MVNQLTAKHCENISHIEVPTELLQQVEKIHNTSTKEGKIKGPNQKRGRNTKGVKSERIQINHVSFTFGVANSKNFCRNF